MISRRDLLRSGAALAGGAITAGARAQQSPETGEASITDIRLDTGWEFYRGNLGGPWEAWRGAKASSNVAWDKVSLPHCVNARDAVDPDAEYYQGPAWYRATIPVKNPYPEGRTLLHFEGAGQKSVVFVYTRPVQPHIGGYDEWTVDITAQAAAVPKEYLDKGVAPIAILCDNSRDLEMIPSSLSDFNLYGGLYRPVHLQYRPSVAIERVHILTDVPPRGKAVGYIVARLSNPATLETVLEVSLRVVDPSGKEVHASTQTLQAWFGDRQLAQFDVLSPELWSPSHPALYQATVSISSPHGPSRIEERFGLRYFEFLDHGPFKLNGERLLLNGTSRHEDHAGLGAAMPEDLIRKEMTLIKEMGANFIRLAHYQQSREVLELCDELGILVWEEIPWCRGGVGGPRYRQQAEGMLHNMIDQHRNHPSIVIWGLGNDNGWPGDFPNFNQADIRAFMSALNDRAHELDSSRKTAARACEFAKDIPDVYSPSLWAGWDSGSYTEYKQLAEEQMKTVKHFFHAEWGGASHARRHSEDADKGPRDKSWSETYICDLFDWHLKEQQTMEWLTGSAQWIFKDFSTPLRPENPVPRVNQKGVVERDLTPKESYYVFQSYWSEKPMAHIYGHTWPVRWGDRGEKKLVKVYSNCPSAELFLNGVSCGVKKRSSQDFPSAALRWLASFKEGENHLRVIAQKDGTQVVDEIRFRYSTQKWNKPARLELAESARSGDKVTLQVRLLDASGLLCLDGRNAVRFGIAGDGTLIDNLGTGRGSRAVELWNGIATISLDRNGGKSVVSVSSKGLSTALLTVA